MPHRSLIAAFLLAMLLLPATATFAQKNASFEQAIGADSSQPAHWNAGGKGYEAMLTGGVAYEGERSLRIKKTGAGRLGVANQSMAADSLAGKRVRLSGHIKTDSLQGGYAGLWMRADGTDGMLSLENMSGRGVTGTTSWTRYEVEMAVPKEAKRLYFGALMPQASGTAWFDALKLEVLQSKDFSPPSEEARAYLDRALDIMQERSINRDSVDWGNLREAVMRRARGAETTADTYDALRYAIRRLGDNHSLLRPPRPEAQQRSRSSNAGQQETGQQKGKGWDGPSPRGQLLSGAIGYVRVPGFIGRGATAFADSLHSIVARLDRKGTCGWVVDLRSDTGGNMWPMLAGLGPVLGEGTAGTFTYPEGREIDWWYREGKAGAGERAIAEVSRTPHETGAPHPPVAVLTGPRTASSGEAVTVSFRGRPNTRSFGQPTAGLSTSNSNITLSDGATLFLTTSNFADRTGTVYGGKIRPDVVVEPSGQPPSLTSDPVVKASQSWLSEQGHCATDDR